MKRGIRLWRRYPHPVLAAARSRSGKNNTQLFSDALTPLRYLKSELFDLRSGYVNLQHFGQSPRAKFKSHIHKKQKRLPVWRASFVGRGSKI